MSARMAAEPVSPASPDTPQRLTPQALAQRYGSTERWWRARLGELVQLGILNKIGRAHWGRPARVEAWLAGELPTRRTRGAA